MTAQESLCSKITSSYPNLEATIKEIKGRSNQATDLDSQKAVIAEYNNLHDTLTQEHASTVEVRDTVVNLRKEMADCIIPVNIGKRAAELKALQDLWNKIHGEFQAFKA